MPDPVEVDDTQSLAFTGHGRLAFSIATWWSISDAVQARASMRNIVDEYVSFGRGRSSRSAKVQVMFTAAGMKALGAAEPELAALSRPFQQGIVSPQRSRALGDAERNDPAQWLWSDEESHALLIVYGPEPDSVETACQTVLHRLEPGWAVTFQLPIYLPADSREHFGFRDGLTRLRVDLGDGKRVGPGVHLLPPGEVLLGYRKAAGTVTSPPPIGRNGTFVAVRQLAQDVQAFWDFWMHQAGGDETEAIWLASKAVGRWPNGMPVTGSVPGPEPAYDEKVARESFSFRDDPYGDHCPLGAHIRRANPRDGLRKDPDISLSLVGQHRIIRRGRAYGSQPPPDWYPKDLRRTISAPEERGSGQARGLLFMCLCADISRQFEFIQQTWLNNPKHADLYDEADAIAGGDGVTGDGRRFSLPRAPLRRRINGVTQWTTVRGAGYFLLPGKRALLGLLGD